LLLLLLLLLFISPFFDVSTFFCFSIVASLMMNLRHRNIVSFYGVCIESGFLSIITEFTEKGNLLDCLIRKRSIKVV
jgi:hypothetical protein